MTFILMIAALVLLAVDWLQSVTIARSSGRWTEQNPLARWLMRVAVERLQLPEVGVHVHFALSAALVLIGAAVVHALWPEHLIGWALLWALLEGYFVRHNHRLGIRPDSITSL